VSDHSAAGSGFEPANCRNTMSRQHEQFSVVQHIRAKAKLRPDSVALADRAHTMSYGMLVAEADRLAKHLHKLGVGAESVVAICLPRSMERVVATLAVMTAGGAFLPLDPAWPASRRREILEDSDAVAMIGNKASLEGVAAKVISVALDCDAEEIAGSAMVAAPLGISAKGLAYIIYTSGSSGRPNGVEITRDNLAHLINWHLEAFAVTHLDRASHAANFGFDAAVWEIWPSLCAGACVVLAPEAVPMSPLLFRDWLVAQRVTIAFVPSIIADSIISAEWPSDTALRLLLTGGAVLHARPRPGLPFEVLNNYGPTECSVVTTSGTVDAGGDAILPDIGFPITNATVHLLDAIGNPVADGSIGELYIGGAGVGRGYRNRPALTALRFLPDHFTEGHGALLYRTGDLGRRMASGRIEFAGRIDWQEQIRGFRVEPEEIAAVLCRHHTVSTAAVVGRDDAVGLRQLVAYIVTSPDHAVGSGELRDFLADLLPDYMIPSYFVQLESLPLTPNGKLDTASLPQRSAVNTLRVTAYRAPSTPTEILMAEIIAEVTGVPEVGSDDNFFHLGGHSLLGTQLVLRARDMFGVDLTLRHVFTAQTAANLAACIETMLVAQVAEMSEDDARTLLNGGESAEYMRSTFDETQNGR
jgi:amino acid adenylation domain-containing protein